MNHIAALKLLPGNGWLQPMLLSSLKKSLVRVFATLFVLVIYSSRASAQTSSQPIYLQCLTNFESYAETIWHPATYPGAPADAGYWGDGTSYSANNGGIRGIGSIAVAYAVLVVALPDDPR